MPRAATPELSHDVLPVGMDDDLAVMYREQTTLTEPETPRAATPVMKSRRYIFRSEPGTIRQQKIRIPGVPPMREDQDKQYGVFVKQYEKKYPDPETRALHDRLVDKLGDRYIDFIPFANKIECRYETDDPEIATFIRGEINANRLRHIFEDAGTITMRCEHCDETFPNTPAGIKALHLHVISKHGG